MVLSYCDTLKVLEWYLGKIQQQRPFPSQYLMEGCTNLLVIEPSEITLFGVLLFDIRFHSVCCLTLDSILRNTLSFYMEDNSFPLPTPEEVLVCNPNTTVEEVLTL